MHKRGSSRVLEKVIVSKRFRRSCKWNDESKPKWISQFMKLWKQALKGKNSTLQNPGIFPPGVRANLLLLTNCSAVWGNNNFVEPRTGEERHLTSVHHVHSSPCVLSWMLSYSQRECVWLCLPDSMGVWVEQHRSMFKANLTLIPACSLPEKNSGLGQTQHRHGERANPCSSLICLGLLLPRHWTKLENCSELWWNARCSQQRSWHGSNLQRLQTKFKL